LITATDKIWLVEGNQANARFGASVGAAGDVNGDNVGDIIIGAPNFSNDETGEGAVFAFYGSAASLSDIADWALESDQTGAAFGASVDTAGDVDGDGYADVIVGAPHYSDEKPDEGVAFIFHGSASGLHSTASWWDGGGKNEALYGAAVGAAGDVNGSGYVDIIVGAPDYKLEHDKDGKVFGYYGPISQPDFNFQVYLPLILRVSP